MHPPPFCRGEGGVEPPTKFTKRGGGVDRTSFRGGGSRKTNTEGGDCLTAWTVCRFKGGGGGLSKKEGWCF